MSRVHNILNFTLENWGGFPTRSLRLAPVIFALVIAICFSSEARGSLLYTFSGANGLSGAFTLAIDTPSSSTCDPTLGCGYFFASPFNSLSGTYGAYSFSGVSRLDILDVPTSYVGSCCQDSWIVRGGSPVLSPPLTGNVVGGRSVTGLNMFIFGSPGAGTLFSGAPLTPPHLDSPNPFNFQYTVNFSDGSLEGGELNTLVLVPEPPSVALLTFGVIGLLVGFKYLGARGTL
jgi:hypothetical protein